MTAEEVRAELEKDQLWRRDEIRFLQNQLANIRSKQDKRVFRKALVVILYSHLEGFCKIAFNVYINAVNSTGIACHEASYAIAAATLNHIFKELRNPNAKANFFRNKLPNDKKLHRFAREREFLERTSDFEAKVVEIPSDIVDMESNLKPVVLRKNLYQLGLPHDLFAALEGDVHKLLNYRNGIAHGSRRKGVAESEYEDLRDCVFRIMDNVTREVMRSYHKRRYRRDTDSAAEKSGRSR